MFIPQALVNVANVGYPVYAFRFYCSQTLLKLFSFPIFRFWAVFWGECHKWESLRMSDSFLGGTSTSLLVTLYLTKDKKKIALRQLKNRYLTCSVHGKKNSVRSYNFNFKMSNIFSVPTVFWGTLTSSRSYNYNYKMFNIFQF